MVDEIESSKDEPLLNAIEARVLGTLMEKQLATPEQYPLTLNSLVVGCNQKTSREPVSNYAKGEVEHCLNELRDKKYVEVEYGSRANRFDQRLSRALFLDKPVHALLTVMLLRGPQTIIELLNRTERMVSWQNSNEIAEVLQTQLQKTNSIFIQLPKQSGQREDRYMHLLCGQPDISEWNSTTDSSVKTSNNADLINRIDAIEKQVEKIMQHLDLRN